VIFKRENIATCVSYNWLIPNQCQLLIFKSHSSIVISHSLACTRRLRFIWYHTMTDCRYWKGPLLCWWSSHTTAKSPGCSPLLGWPMCLSSRLVLVPVQLKAKHIIMSPFAYIWYLCTLVYRNDGFRQNYSWEDISWSTRLFFLWQVCITLW